MLRLGALGAGTAAAPWLMNLAAMAPARAATGGGYKALVCLFMYGGNDAYNTVLATDADSWARYTVAREQAPDPIALAAVGVPGNPAAGAGMPARLGGVLPLAQTANTQNPGRSFALHPLLGGVRDLFAAQRLAIVPNVGPLIQPTVKPDYRNPSFPKPAKLFSHNDCDRSIVDDTNCRHLTLPRFASSTMSRKMSTLMLEVEHRLRNG